MSINNIKLDNFTVFEKIDINFTNGVNVIIGENGSGKSHLMKVMYILSKSEGSGEKFKCINDYFNTTIDDVFRNKRHESTFLSIDLNSTIIEINLIIGNSIELKGNKGENLNSVPTFIPAKDMLTHSKGFLPMYDKFELPFDKTCYDIISKSLLPNLKKIPVIGETILPKIEHIIEGKVIVENDTFFIEKNNGDKVVFSMEAEGIKKIAILWQLIMNESIAKGSVLFWDEPEANINPSLYKDVAEILLELSRNDVQIFIATHNYNFAKYIEVLSKESDNALYHSLYKTDHGVKCETETKFTLLSNNALREDNINLYDEEMKKEFEE